MSGLTREFWAERYAWLGGAYLVVVSALHWSRGGPAVRDPRAESVSGAAGELLAFYGAWYAVGLVLVGLGWWRAAVRDRRA
jgi:hypothetical protein